MRRRVEGNTLVELLVVLAILGVVAGVAGLSSRADPTPAAIDAAGAQVAAARREAIRAGRSVTVVVSRDGHVSVATAHADGSVVADSALSIDRFTGTRGR
jgi:prepilin-type N-terminal cleavage/methylation domain-containing protein